MIFGIDPGTTESGWVHYDDDSETVMDAGVDPNDTVLREINLWDPGYGPIAIENIESSRGMPVGADTFTTVRWVGRFQQAARFPETVILIPRLAVKVNICGSAKAKDSNIRQALIDRLGAPGVKADKGPTYGVKSHAWAALAVAVTARDQLEGKQ